MKKTIIIVIIISLYTFPLISDSGKRTLNSLTASLTMEERKILIDDDIVFRYGRERKGLYYIPFVPLSDNILKRFKKLDPDVTVEAIFRVPYPDDLPEGPDRDIILYNIVREVSSISGVQYFSHRKQKYRVLFDDVYAIDEKKRPVEDPFLSVIPEYDSFPIHMKEANLGRDYYLAEYFYDGDDFSFSLTNTSNMSFLFKVVGEGNMQIDLLLMPLDDEVIIYGYCGVKLANPGFVTKIMDPFSSFFRRLLAMEIWFSNSLHGTDILPVLSDNVQG